MTPKKRSAWKSSPSRRRSPATRISLCCRVTWHLHHHPARRHLRHLLPLKRRNSCLGLRLAKKEIERRRLRNRGISPAGLLRLAFVFFRFAICKINKARANFTLIFSEQKNACRRPPNPWPQAHLLRWLPPLRLLQVHHPNQASRRSPCLHRATFLRLLLALLRSARRRRPLRYEQSTITLRKTPTN